ncbi:hypothetical protein [Halalkalirubrum salinum]
MNTLLAFGLYGLTWSSTCSAVRVRQLHHSSIRPARTLLSSTESRLTQESQYYLRSKKQVEIASEDIVCHLLLINDGGRYRSYCLLLIIDCELEPDTLTRTAGRYDREVGSISTTLFNSSVPTSTPKVRSTERTCQNGTRSS